MLMMPNISAVEYNNVKETLESELSDNLQNIKRSLLNSESTSLLATILAVILIMIVDLLSLIFVTVGMAITINLSEDYPKVSAILSLLGGLFVGAFQGSGLIFIAKQFRRANEKIISVLSLISLVALEIWIFLIGTILSKNPSNESIINRLSTFFQDNPIYNFRITLE